MRQVRGRHSNSDVQGQAVQARAQLTRYHDDEASWREQAVAAAEVNEVNWTSAVDVIATPKRAVVFNTPNAAEVPPQTHRGPADAGADLAPPQQPQCGSAAHGLYFA